MVVACDNEKEDQKMFTSNLPKQKVISDSEFTETVRLLKGNAVDGDTILMGFVLGETKVEIAKHLSDLKQRQLIEDFDEIHFRFKIASGNKLFNCLGIIHSTDKLNGIYCLIGAPEHLLPKLPLDDCEGEQFNPYTSAQCKAQKITAYETEYKIREYRFIDSAFQNILNAYQDKYSNAYHQTENEGEWSPYIWFNKSWLLKLQIKYENSSDLLEYYGDYFNNKNGVTTKTLDPSFFFPTIATVYYFSYGYYDEINNGSEKNKPSKRTVPTI